VVTPASIRQVPITSTALAPGAQPKTRPVHEITIAVDPDEVGPLTEALALNSHLTCVARSGQPSDVPEKETPVVATPEPKVTTIETIVNGKVVLKHFVEPAPAKPTAPSKLEVAPPPRPVPPKPDP
jgi:methyl coenzyme M reductase subunit C